MNKTIEKIVSLCKQRGFVYQSSDIYGGFGAVYDYGPLGVELKNNIANLWWKEMTRNHENIVGLRVVYLCIQKSGKLLAMSGSFMTH